MVSVNLKALTPVSLRTIVPQLIRESVATTVPSAHLIPTTVAPVGRLILGKLLWGFVLVMALSILLKDVLWTGVN